MLRAMLRPMLQPIHWPRQQQQEPCLLLSKRQCSKPWPWVALALDHRSRNRLICPQCSKRQFRRRRSVSLLKPSDVLLKTAIRHRLWPAGRQAQPQLQHCGLAGDAGGATVRLKMCVKRALPIGQSLSEVTMSGWQQHSNGSARSYAVADARGSNCHWCPRRNLRPEESCAVQWAAGHSAGSQRTDWAVSCAVVCLCLRLRQ